MKQEDEKRVEENTAGKSDQEIIKEACELLSENLVDTAQFKNLWESRQKLSEKPEAEKLLKEYNQARQMSRRMGGLNLGEAGEKISEVEEKMKDFPEIKEYVTAEEKWKEFLQEFFAECSQELGFDILSALGGCC